ncbi:MAG: hypothetical protein IRZ16_13375 [Myxococcaceae bacterium]|nr:hypothetical protein [Myxococcaceae bacterium]
MKRLWPALVGALAIVGWTGTARAEHDSVPAAADTYVRRDNNGPYGTQQELIIKNKGDGKMTRKALIRFQMGPASRWARRGRRTIPSRRASS